MTIILTPDALKYVVGKYRESGEVAIDVETMGEHRRDPLRAPVHWISLANMDRADTIPIDFPNGDLLSERKKPNKKGAERMARGVAYEDLNPKYDLSVEIERTFGPPPAHMSRAEVMEGLEPLLTDRSVLKIAHNAKFDIHALSKYYGNGVEGPFWDTMIVEWLFDSRRVRGRNTPLGGLSLKDSVWRTLGWEMEKGVGEDISQHAFFDVHRYAQSDAESAFDLYADQSRRVGRKGRMRWLVDLEMNALNPVLEMERSGVQIDRAVLEELGEEILAEARDIEEWFRKFTGDKDFNIRSNVQKQELLFRPKSMGGLAIRSAKLTPSGQDAANKGLETSIYDLSVDHSVLEAHRNIPAVGKLLDYSLASKIYGTYVQPYTGGESISGLEGKHKESQLRGGRIYGHFNQAGTESGRFSSSDPNLQNIPSRTPRGRRVREAFVAYPSETLIVADYSQIEPRIIASLSGDRTMLEAYRNAEDVYETVAKRMSVGRSAGKTLVLAIAYGVGPAKIAADIGCSLDEARDLMEYFAKLFPSIVSHKSSVLREAKRTGYSDTIFGRRRRLDLKNPSEAIRKMAERQAYNHLIQGSAADIMKMALVNVHAALPDEATIIMTVHDELVVSAPSAMAEDVSQIVKEEMEGSCPSRYITVPLVANVQTGHSWADCK